MKNKQHKIPHFTSREEEATFWETHSVADYWDTFAPVDLAVELTKPKEETLVVRVTSDVKRKLEVVAKDKGVTVSTLARILLSEHLKHAR
jgi:predicted HicB family RNase H-like nuclease